MIEPCSIDGLVARRKSFLTQLRSTPPVSWPDLAASFVVELKAHSFDRELARLFLVLLIADVGDRSGVESPAASSIATSADPYGSFTEAIACIARPLQQESCSAQLIRLIRSRYAEHLTVTALAKAVGRHRSHLSEVFRRETGVTIHEYLTAVRVEKAREMLAHGDKVEAAMMLVGYRSKKAFYQQFRNRTGSTPGMRRRIS